MLVIVVVMMVTLVVTTMVVMANNTRAAHGVTVKTHNPNSPCPGCREASGCEAAADSGVGRYKIILRHHWYQSHRAFPRLRCANSWGG